LLNGSGSSKNFETVPDGPSTDEPSVQSARINSIDALRGFVMFMMIFVNDLAGAGKIVPDWMVHFSDRHRGGSGMTFVDLVFPAFLFLVGMSISVAFRARMAKGHSRWGMLGHIGRRTLALLFIGILMVHEVPDTATLGWPGEWWCVLMYLSAIICFSSISPPASASASRRRVWQTAVLAARLAGFAALIWLAFSFRGANGQRIVSLNPFAFHTQWYGILGLIGWSYLVTSIVFLVFHENRTGILACMVLLMCLFAADKGGLFEGFWLSRVVGIGEMLGSLASIAVGGLLLGSILTTGDITDLKARTKFVFCFVVACSAAALLLNRAYGISKNAATPSWCLWACAITAALWYGFHLLSDRDSKPWFSRLWVLAGQNVLLAYLISEMIPSLLDALGISEGYSRLASNLPSAVARSAVCGLLVLLVSSSLNRIGFRIRL
jgi:heparan-alpha-glucosaminide N-acetyltransferase